MVSKQFADSPVFDAVCLTFQDEGGAVFPIVVTDANRAEQGPANLRIGNAFVSQDIIVS
ncbi:hypothetical protein SAMN05216227_100986 [Pseudorhodobacter antarcticus]|jgi:hypothetical protein|uniref:Uncharacterized protein n=1 Tax=Pseudorhodobacter antarcticus TaxID=1077947 RepID=A0A1H8ES41_9RHOB|nr:hypothetical protein SAMN05216227_100986 [Pseudorhodobacter antarcticus]